MSRVVQLHRLGLLPYRQTMQVMQDHVSLHFATGINSLLLLQHTPVYTVGIRNTAYPHSEEQRLVGLGAEFVRSERGGLITFHGPGQLIAYPILSLRELSGGSVKRYVNMLEQSVIDLLRQYNICASRDPCNPGVWVPEGKVCALGIRVQRGVSSHGIALNCSTDLSYFGHIVPCGLPDRTVSSISALAKREVTVDEVIPKFVSCFGEVFGCKVEEQASAEFANS